ncbi:hypothetical protein [Allosphingosinicella vermicomposti]|uniref:hypothetical protein n=1 Tax=Allosphingosinicella vermicomposti TaxID=614671 RepID=UPI00131A5F8F|nr:hypothetical protein [Allosphingosinicella vermicomposti]
MTDNLELVDKTSGRAQRNFLSALAMLGHLVALYDRGVFESARLMSNLICQIAVKKANNLPLLSQVGVEGIKIIVDRSALGASVLNSSSSPLASLLFGGSHDGSGGYEPRAHWVPLVFRLSPPDGFVELSIDTWLDDPVIPTSNKIMSRRDLIIAVRDADGGAHSDSDQKFLKHVSYIELINSFPIHKNSEAFGTNIWNMLPPVILPMLRQIAHELLSSVYSQVTELRDIINPPPSLVCIFEGAEFRGAFAPKGYIAPGKVYGREPIFLEYPVSV